MATYNRTKAADRAQELADREAEIAAIDQGIWPRNIDDYMRWGAGKSFFDMAERAAFARRLCASDVAYLRTIPYRVATGELRGWEG